MNLSICHQIFMKLDLDDNNCIDQNQLVKFLNIIGLSIDGIDRYLDKEKYTFDDAKIIMESLIKAKKSCKMKYHELESYLLKQSQSDERTVKFILKEVYGNINPLEEIDTKKLEKYIDNIYK